MSGVTLTLSHPYKEMRERTTKEAEGKEPPSLGSGGPSLAAVGVRGTEANEGNEEVMGGKRNMAMVFEQQRRESAKAFEAFRVYLGMGPRRTFGGVVREAGVNRKSVLAWSKRFDWRGRVAAHGAHLAKVEREAAEAVVREKGVDWGQRYLELREAEWKARQEALELAQEAIARWKESPRRHGSLEGIARLLDLMSVLGRRACEVATERKEVTGGDGGPIRVEIEAALDKIYGKPIPGEVVETEVLTGGNGGNGEEEPRTDTGGLLTEGNEGGKQ